MKKKGGVSTYIWVFFLTVRDEEDVEAETEDEDEDETEDEDVNDVKWLSGDDFVPPFNADQMFVSQSRRDKNVLFFSFWVFYFFYLFIHKFQSKSTSKRIHKKCAPFKLSNFYFYCGAHPAS